VVVGAALPLAFAPWELSPLAPLLLAVLFGLWLQPQAPGRAALRGWLFGLGFFGAGTSWVRESFGFSDVPAAAALVLTAGFVAFLALYPALLGYLQGRLAGGLSGRWRALGVLPAGWVLLEWVRGWFLTGFPWIQVGYSQVEAPLGWLAPVFGAYGVGWAVAASAGLLVVLARGGWRERVGAGTALAALWVVAWGLGQVEWTQASGPPRNVAVVQGNIAQDLKWKDEQRVASMAHYLALTREHWDADLVVWPETAVPAFAHRVRPFLADLADEARTHGAGLLLGIPFRDLETGRYYNSVMSLGAEVGVYHKRHLVPFGEYVPLSSVLGRLLDLLNAPMSDFSSGPPDQPPLPVDGLQVGVSICYEDAFGEEVMHALPAADLLVNVSNDAWFGDTVAPHQHQQKARMRAIEAGRDLIRATNTGISAIINWRGAVTASAPQFQSAVLRGVVIPRTGTTPYAVLGNAPVVAGAVFTLLAAWAVRRRRAGTVPPRSADRAGSPPAP
jgi:apolipoprotein N-acyltransferase